MSRRPDYQGAHTLIQVPRRQFERNLATSAENIRRDRVLQQSAFDIALAAYRKSVDSSIDNAARREAVRTAWRRVEEGMAALRREAAYWRIRARLAEKRLAEKMPTE